MTAVYNNNIIITGTGMYRMHISILCISQISISSTGGRVPACCCQQTEIALSPTPPLSCVFCVLFGLVGWLCV